MHHPLIEKAQRLASEAHAGQTYGPDQPYTVHLAAVAAVMKRYVAESDPSFVALVAAAWLHDTLEDTAWTQDQLREVLGDRRVVELAEAVTDEPGANRAERKAKTYPKTLAGGRDAILVKLADRIANVEASANASRAQRHHLDTYRDEHTHFAEVLHRADASPEEERMWTRLAALLQ